MNAEKQIDPQKMAPRSPGRYHYENPGELRQNWGTPNEFIEMIADEVEKRIQRLTPRETQVLELVVQGKANKVIAGDLDVSQRTVEIHRARVMEKMEVRSLAQLVRVVMQAEE